jgi:hypothetical protein
MKALLIHLGFMGGALLSLAQAASIAPQKESQPPLSQAAVQNAFQLLRSEYIRADKLDHSALGRAALRGLLQELDLGASLIRNTDTLRPPIAEGLISEKLTPSVAYERFQSFTQKEVHAFREQLKSHAETKVQHVILDLRHPAAPGDFEVAANLLESFVPEGELMFKLKQAQSQVTQLYISHQKPIWNRPCLVLIDEDCCNLAETVAAVLKQRGLALLIGSPTRGATVRFETRPLDALWSIRYARAEMQLPDNTSLFGQGLTPDFPIILPPGMKQPLFAADQRPSLRETFFETPRPRYNEAALVNRRNPELDDFIRRSAGLEKQSPSKLPKDQVLQRAVDMIITRSFFEQTQLKWEMKDSSQPKTIHKTDQAP